MLGTFHLRRHTPYVQSCLWIQKYYTFFFFSWKLNMLTASTVSCKTFKFKNVHLFTRRCNRDCCSSAFPGSSWTSRSFSWTFERSGCRLLREENVKRLLRAWETLQCAVSGRVRLESLLVCVPDSTRGSVWRG